jgi:hypothetical protein
VGVSNVGASSVGVVERPSASRETVRRAGAPYPERAIRRVTMARLCR